MWLLWRLWGLVRRLLKTPCPDWWETPCPACGYTFEQGEEPWFDLRASGSYAVPGEPRTHWQEGVQTCPRCRYRWELSDTS